MALFNNIFFNTGFLCGISNWFSPSFMFCNPVRSFNMFNFLNLFSSCSVWNNDYRYNIPEMPVYYQTNYTLPSLNYENFKVNDSIWGNYKFDLPNTSSSSNFDSFDFSGLKNISTKTTETADSKKTFNTEIKTNNATGSTTETTKTTGSPRKSNTKKLRSKGKGGAINYKYKNMSRSDALAAAKKDNNLEDLSTKNNSGWVLKHTFATDIPYAKKGTATILQKVYEMTGIRMEISSALGTKGSGSGSPHKGMGYSSHHNAENPKLDISYSSIAGKNMDGYKFADILWNTGLFNWIYVEGDHLDVQIDPDAYSKYA